MKMVHYTEKNGNEQYQLQRLAKDILDYGKKIDECHHTSQQFFPNGEQRTIEQGSYCIEVKNEMTGIRYWVHFNGCRVTEIIEEREE